MIGAADADLEPSSGHSQAARPTLGNRSWGSERWNRWYPSLALIVIGVASFALRFALLGRYPALPSADHGNYLAQVQILYGNDVSGNGYGYPPLFLLFLAGLLRLFDTMTALKLSIAVPAAFIPFPTYGILARRSTRPFAVMGALLLTFGEAYSEMTGWGGGPDFLALPFFLASLLFLLRYLDTARRADVLWAAVFAALVLATHQLTALMLVLSIFLWAVFEFLRARTWASVSPFVRFGALGALFSVPLAPLYVIMESRLAPSISPWWPDALANTGSGLIFVFRDSLFLWIPITALAVLGVRTLLAERQHDGLLFLAIVAASLGLALTFMRDIATRPLYFLYLPILGGFVVSCQQGFQQVRRVHRDPKTGTATALVIVALVISSTVLVAQSAHRMSASVDWYHAIEAPELDGLNWVRDHTPTTAVIATAGLPFFSDLEGNRFGWWIEGYSGRKAFYTGDATSFTFKEDRARVEAAARFFTGNYMMEGASLRLVDNSPGVPENPGLSVKWGGTFVPALYLNDAINVVTYSSDNATVNSTWVPYPGAQTWTGTINSTGSPELEVVQSKDEFNVTRTETINDISASIGLSFRTTNTTLRAIDFDVWVGSDLVLGEAETWTDGISGVLSGGSSISIPFTIMVAHDASVAVELTPTNQEPLFRVPAIEIHASAGPNATTVRLGLTITFPGLPTDGQPIALYTASEIAAAYGIGYVFQSQCLDAMYRRFATDTADFTVVYQNERIAIYEVHFGNR